MEFLQMRALNPDGLEQMRIWLAQARNGLTASVPEELLVSPAFSEAKGAPVPLGIFCDKAFATKLSLAEAVVKAVTASGLDEAALENDQGFWSWLTLRFAERLIGDKGQVGEDALWIFEPGNWRKLYRHKMAPLWLAYRAHQDNPYRLKAVLGGAVNRTGEVFEQMMARKWIVLSPGIMELVTRLYYDDESNALKKGSGGKEAGSPRRLSTLLDQLSLTYDIENIECNRLMGMLPGDFNRFL